MKRSRLLATSFLAWAGAALAAAPSSRERVYLDSSGVIRWTVGDEEIALFGANYCLPSSSDYRAAGYIEADRKKLIEQDMAHFARLGWDGLRLAIWGDWENCDREGNLIVNDHLDLLDYLVFVAKQQGISMLFTPIHRHSALWPDGKDSDAIQGFSKFYPVSELGTNPAAIAAQQNYIRQILEHVNPYTGVALKDEPAILFIELINEPHHHADDIPGSIRYINALADAVRSTGCEKLLFHNLSQDFRILPAIVGSKAQGFSFGWYPTALGARRTLTENYLRWVDDYAPLRESLPPLPRIVYEFDSADMLSPTMYPAMVRSFREVGAQFAAMFAYDMIGTAPYNLGWQTHYLNLVYSPKKAVGAIIAAEAMRRLPRGQNYGDYPLNCGFGDFRVSYAEDLSEMVTAERFFHANSTTTRPRDPAKLLQLIGVGSSPVVRYEGNGSYFLERIDAGRWRLEVYPDAVLVQDPFAQRLNHQSVSSRLVWREWPMQIDLPDLGSNFIVRSLDSGNGHTGKSSDGRFNIRPGVYLLSRPERVGDSNLPERVGRVGLREFVCPPPAHLPPQVVSHAAVEYVTDADATLAFDVVAETEPQSVILHVRHSGEDRTFPMTAAGGFRYVTVIPGGTFDAGEIEFAVTVATHNSPVLVPEPSAGPWRTSFVTNDAPLLLLEAGRDAAQVFTPRSGGDRAAEFLQRIPASGTQPAALRWITAPRASATPRAVSLPVKTAIHARGQAVATATALRLNARGAGAFIVALVEDDGTAWSGTVEVNAADWEFVSIPLTALRASTALKLPLGYPGNWNRELRPAANRGGAGDTLQLPQVEHLQVTALPPTHSSDPATHLDLRRVELQFEP